MKLVFLLSLALILFSGCLVQPEQPSSDLKALKEQVTITFRVLDSNGYVIEEKGVNVLKGSNAFDALNESFAVDSQDFVFGKMVKGINKKYPKENEYWALYVNGFYAEKGISDYTLKEDTLIEWKPEKIESFIQ